MLNHSVAEAQRVEPTAVRPDPLTTQGPKTMPSIGLRNTGIDVIKGGAIVLVILGHAIQSHVDQFDDNTLFRLIYSFHMPLFMILAGWFAYPGQPWRLRKTSIRLVLPVFSWYFIAYFVECQFRTASPLEYLARWIKSPDVGLWFLWILFLCHLLLVVAKLAAERLGIAAYGVGAILLYIVPFSEMGAKMIKWYFPFFALGYVVSLHWDRCAKHARAAAIAGLLVFLLAFPHWQRSSVGHLPVYFHIVGHRIEMGFVVLLTARVACALSGSVVFAYFITLAARGQLKVLLVALGSLTLELYAVHQLLIRFAFGQGPVAVFSSAIMTTIMSLLVIWALKKSRWASLVLFGRIPTSSRVLLLQHEPY